MTKSTQFKKGQSGNPNGRPKGARNVTTRAVEALLEGDAENLTRVAIKKGLDGDTTALRLCLDRICPPRKDRPVELDIPATTTAQGLVKAMGTIIAATAAGEITPTEGTALASLIDAQRRTTETENLERRIAALEQVAPRK